MRKSVKCEFFGENQYIYFDIDRLMQFEKLIGCSVFEVASAGRISLSVVLNGLMVGMQQHYRMKADEWGERMQKAFDAGYSLIDMGGPVFEAVVASGIFGKPETPEEIDEKKAPERPEATD
ncbi:MAG: hypothetical protein IKT09_04955 [Synergistes sp.]|nr:hypothetical protein [Synergistes sp.]